MSISNKIENLKMKIFKKNIKKVEKKLDDKNFLSEVIEDLNKKIENKKNQSVEALEDAFLFLYLLKDWVSGNYRDFSKKTVIYIIAGVIYFISPIDAIPDVILKLGFIDDFSIFALIISANKEEIEKYKKYKNELKDNENELKQNNLELNDKNE